MKLIVIGVLLSVLAGSESALAVHELSPSMGILAHDVYGPHYGDPNTFSWTDIRRVKFPNFAVVCYQDLHVVYVYETSIPRTPSGSITVTIEQATNTMSGLTLDETRTGYCTAEVFNERSGNHDPEQLAPGISFTEEP